MWTLGMKFEYFLYSIAPTLFSCKKKKVLKICNVHMVKKTNLETLKRWAKSDSPFCPWLSVLQSLLISRILWWMILCVQRGCVCIYARVYISAYTAEYVMVILAVHTHRAPHILTLLVAARWLLCCTSLFHLIPFSPSHSTSVLLLAARDLVRRMYPNLFS